MRLLAPLLLAALGACAPGPPPGDGDDRGPIHVAVAANFGATFDELATAFRAASGRAVLVSRGSSGQLATQAAHGAPYHLLLSADSARPRALEEQGVAVAGTRRPYAQGRLVLVGRGLPADGDGDGEAALRAGAFQHLALAHPDVAPYGAAAGQVLAALGLEQALAEKLVFGTSVTQALQFVDGGGAELGFVALSQVLGRPDARYWLVPAALHTPIRQEAVLLREHAGARELLDFLAGAAAGTILERHGYEPVLAAAGGHVQQARLSAGDG